MKAQHQVTEHLDTLRFVSAVMRGKEANAEKILQKLVNTNIARKIAAANQKPLI